MQSVKGAQRLIFFLFVLFTAVSAAAMFGTVVFPLTSMHESL